MRQLEPWRKYAQLITVLSEASPEGAFRPQPGQVDARERRLIDEFCLDLGKRRDRPEAKAVLKQLNLSRSYVLQHLRYVARWTPDFRVALAKGVALGALEPLSTRGQQLPAHLQGALQGADTAELRQVRQQGRFSRQQTIQEAYARHHRGPHLGWIEPGSRVTAQRPLPRIWTFSTRGVTSTDQLHPRVAEALIRACVTRPGSLVVDPMAGSGVVGIEASKLGHRAWVSDVDPRSTFVAQFEIPMRDDQGKQDADELNEALRAKLGGVQADLLVLHPPLRSDLDDELEVFTEKLLERTIRVLKPGGKVALIVPVLEAPRALHELTQALCATLPAQRAKTRAVQTLPLSGHHVAVSVEGTEGWHLLIGQQG